MNYRMRLDPVPRTPEVCNNNNFPTDIHGKVITPDDYTKLNTSVRWERTSIHCTKLPTKCIELSGSILETLRRLCKIGECTGRFSSYMKSESEEVVEFLESELSDFAGPYFARLSLASPKDSEYWPSKWNPTGRSSVVGLPTAESIVKVCTTSGRAGRSLNVLEDPFLIVQPWISDIPWNHEVRIFVRNRKLTAISQYNVSMDTQMGPLLTPEVLDRFEPFVRNCLSRANLQNCTIDAVILQNELHFVEFNSFGMESPAGSGLFDWISDSDILYGLTEPVFRFIAE